MRAAFCQHHKIVVSGSSLYQKKICSITENGYHVRMVLASSSFVFNGYVYVTMQITSLTRKCPNVGFALNGPSTVICLHYTSYRAEHRQSGPSTVDPGRAYLLSAGQTHMTFEWAEHSRKRLHYTKPGSARRRAR